MKETKVTCGAFSKNFVKGKNTDIAAVSPLWKVNTKIERENKRIKRRLPFRINVQAHLNRSHTTP